MMTFERRLVAFAALFTVTVLPGIERIGAADQTPYDNLDELYSAATAPAAASVFGAWSAPTKICQTIFSDAPTVFVASLTGVLVESTPNDGPLYPSVAVSRVLMGLNPGDDPTTDFFDVTNSTSATDLEVTLTFNYMSTGNLGQLTAFFRQGAQYVLYSGNETVAAYGISRQFTGYCY